MKREPPKLTLIYGGLHGQPAGPQRPDFPADSLDDFLKAVLSGEAVLNFDALAAPVQESPLQAPLPKVRIEHDPFGGDYLAFD